MKINFLILFVCVVLIFSACKVDMEQYHSSPKIGIAAGVLPNKTISIYYNTETGMALTDTVQLGDTVRFLFKLNAFGFQLIHFHIEKPESYALIDVLSPDSISKIVSSNSSLPELNFYFLNNISYLAMPINYIPTRVRIPIV